MDVAVDAQLKRALERAVAQVRAGGSIALALALACECPTTVSNAVRVRPLTESEASLLGLRVAAGQELSAATCESLCEPGPNDAGDIVSCKVTPPVADTTSGANEFGTLECVVPVASNCGGVGRWTRGARLGAERGIDYFADAAAIERVAVTAFRRLERDLDRFGAPLVLRQRARRSRNDEVRHAQTMRRFARGASARSRAIAVASEPPRTRFSLALENAVYGCVEETWGAMLLAEQARQAEDLRARRALRRIARDERRHAELAWELHRWLMPSLTSAERAEVDAAMSRAMTVRVAAPLPELPMAIARAVGLAAPTIIPRIRKSHV